MKLTSFIGPDRVGKSTTAAQYVKLLESFGLKVKLQHFSEPSVKQTDIFQRYRVSVEQAISEGVDELVWDRSYLCAFVYERFREQSHSFIGDVMAFESYLMRNYDKVQFEHILLSMPWEEICFHHWEEIVSNNPGANDWALGRDLIYRSREHSFYLDEAEQFLATQSIHPYSVLSSRLDINKLLNLQT